MRAKGPWRILPTFGFSEVWRAWQDNEHYSRGVRLRVAIIALLQHGLPPKRVSDVLTLRPTPAQIIRIEELFRHDRRTQALVRVFLNAADKVQWKLERGVEPARDCYLVADRSCDSLRTAVQVATALRQKSIGIFLMGRQVGEMTLEEAREKLQHDPISDFCG